MQPGSTSPTARTDKRKWRLDQGALTSCIVGLTTFCLLSAFFEKLRELRRSPPGPWGFPIFGCLPHLMFSSSKSFRSVFQNWHNKFGPIYNLKIGSANVVIIGDFEIVKAALVRPEFQDRIRFDFMMDRPGDGVVLANGRVWKEQRKFVFQYFRDFGIGKASFEDVVATEAKHLARELLNFDGQTLDVEPLIHSAISNVISMVTFGRRFDYDDKNFQRVLTQFDETMKASLFRHALSVFLPFTRFIPIGGSQQIRDHFKVYFNFHDDMVAEHRGRQSDGGTIRDMMDAYMLELERNEKNGISNSMTDGNMLWTIGDLFTAGNEITTTTIVWAILFLLKHPHAGKKAKDDLDAIVGRNRLPSYSDRSKLGYIEAVIAESLRLGTLSGLGFPHVASTDTSLMGYHIPKGTILFPNVHAMFTAEGKWDRPDEFRPERFLDKEGNFIKREDFIPFSIGRRLCLGRDLATMEHFLFLTHMVHQMTFSVPKEGELPPDKGTEGLTHKSHPFKVFLQKRDDL